MDTCPAEKCKHFFRISLDFVLMMCIPEPPVRAYRWTNEIRVEMCHRGTCVLAVYCGI